MVAKKCNGLITLLTFYTIFHELGVSQDNFHLDKHGRSWRKTVDPESGLFCFTCQTHAVFPSKPELEMKVKYI